MCCIFIWTTYFRCPGIFWNLSLSQSIMDSSFFVYLERLELISFFAAYPLIFTLVQVISNGLKKNRLTQVFESLPYAYALVGTLYIGLQIRDLYPDFSLENIRLSVQLPLLKIWAILSLFFWLPVLARKPYISLLHSLVFFFLLAKDLFVQQTGSAPDKYIIKNDMNLFTDSLLINAGSLIFVFLISLFYSRVKRH